MSKSPCWFSGWSYYTQLRCAMLAPLLLTLALVLGGMVEYAVRAHRAKKRGQPVISDLANFTPNRMTRERRDRLRANHLKSPLKAGLWTSAHLVLFCLDLLYPAVCRVLFQFATCRNLNTGPDATPGWWLEADYSVECFTAKYWTYAPFVSAAGLTYAVGVPLLFFYLLYHFQEIGKAGDKVVHRALGPSQFRGTPDCNESAAFAQLMQYGLDSSLSLRVFANF